jgi:hypothetical protein
MPRAMTIVGASLLFSLLAGCGSSGGSSADAGEGSDGTTGGSSSGDDGSSGGGSSGGSSGAASSGGASSGGTSSGASSSGASSSGAGSSGASGSSSGTASSGGGLPDAGPYVASVYQHHKNGSRNGLYVDPVLTSGTTGHASTMHVLATMGTVTTEVYAQPLFVQMGIPNITADGAFIVATEENHVTAINATTGAVLWDKGPSLYGQNYSTGLGLPCGDVRPLGITGTPFIDPASSINGGNGVIYFDAMTTPDGGTTLKHLVYAVKLADGTVLPNWPVDVSAKVSGFNSPHQNERGALQLVNGILYVPYGGHDGDCNPYYGWVVGIPVSTPQSPTGWHTTAERGGIWGPGALPTDGTSIFPITGNTLNTTMSGTKYVWGGGEAVIRLAAGPTFSGNTTDYYAPTNWHDLDDGDTDLGGASEVLLDLPGTSKPHLVAAGGKDGHLYLLNRDNLGGIGAELFNTAMANSEFKGAPIAYTTTKATYVAFHVEGGSGTGCPSGQGSGNLVAYKITGGTGNPTATTAWCSNEANLGSPMVTTTDGTSDAVVWDASDHLYAYDGDTGAKLYAGGTSATAIGGGVQGWNTPISVGNGRIAVGVNGALYIFQN